MALDYVQLILDLHDGSGNLIPSGNISFTPSAQLTAPDEEFVPKAAVAASLNPVVAGTISLLATDNASVSPSGWGWNVAFYGVPGNPGTFSFLLPYSAGGTQYFSAQVPAASVSSLQTYMRVPSGSAVSGYVPTATGSGNASEWASVTSVLPVAGTATAGIVTLAGDLGGSGTAPSVVATSLTSALPVDQGGTGGTTSAAGLANLGGFSSPMTALGDMIYGGSAGAADRLAGTTGTVQAFLAQTGSGTVSAAPAWATITAANMPFLGAVTVSPTGIATGDAPTANNGAQFGPDTPGTTTQGLQEAVTYAIGLVAGTTGATIAPPRLVLGPGEFDVSSTITVPVPSNVAANNIGFEVEGSGHLSTIVRFSGGEGFLFGQYAWQDVVFRNMSIAQLNGSTVTSLITVKGTGTTYPDTRSEMMFSNVWFELDATPSGLPSNGVIYFAPVSGQTGGFDLYFTNCALAGSFSITSPFNASFVNCLVASGSGVTFTTSTALTTFTACEIAGAVILSAASGPAVTVDNSYWVQIPATEAVLSKATSGATEVNIRNSQLNFLGSAVIVSQASGGVELHFHQNNTYVASSGTYSLMGGGGYLSHTSTYGGNYPDGYLGGTGTTVGGTTLGANPPVSGTSYQNTYGIALHLYVPITYNPTSSAAATCTLGLGTGSLSTLTVGSYPAGSTAGIVTLLHFRVPSGWYYEITTANATVGTAVVVPEQ